MERPLRSPRPREISHLVQDLQRARAQDQSLRDQASQSEQGRAMFLIGAGCSASAGIPLASEVAKEAVVGLAKTYKVQGFDEGTPLPEILSALMRSRCQSYDPPIIDQSSLRVRKK
jgi:hypothetical protein